MAGGGALHHRTARAYGGYWLDLTPPGIPPCVDTARAAEPVWHEIVGTYHGAFQEFRYTLTRKDADREAREIRDLFEQENDDGLYSWQVYVKPHLCTSNAIGPDFIEPEPSVECPPALRGGRTARRSTPTRPRRSTTPASRS